MTAVDAQAFAVGSVAATFAEEVVAVVAIYYASIAVLALRHAAFQTRDAVEAVVAAVLCAERTGARRRRRLNTKPVAVA